MALGPNTAYFLLNPTKSKYSSGLPDLSGLAGTTPGDMLGSFANYNAFTDAPLPGSEGAVNGQSAPLSSGDYLNLINNDPLYQQAGKDLSAQGIADAASTGADVLRGLVQRGVVPNFAGVAGQLGLSPQIVSWLQNNVDLGQASALAQQNNAAGTSEEAQLAHQHTLNMGNIADQLAARGLLRSGALAFDTGEEERRNTIARSQADQQLADYISGAYKAFANNEANRQAQLRQAASDAATRQAQILGSGVPGGTASSGGGSSTTGGSGSSSTQPSITNVDYLSNLAKAKATGRPVAV